MVQQYNMTKRLGPIIFEDNVISKATQALISSYLVPKAEQNLLTLRLTKSIAGLDAFMPLWVIYRILNSVQIRITYIFNKVKNYMTTFCFTFSCIDIGMFVVLPLCTFRENCKPIAFSAISYPSCQFIFHFQPRFFFIIMRYRKLTKILST